MENIDKLIADRIRKVREEELQINQDQAATMCDITHVTYQRAEDPTRSLSVKTLINIAKGYKKPIGWFCGEQSYETTPEQALEVLAEAIKRPREVTSEPPQPPSIRSIVSALATLNEAERAEVLAFIENGFLCLADAADADFVKTPNKLAK